MPSMYLRISPPPGRSVLPGASTSRRSYRHPQNHTHSPLCSFNRRHGHQQPNRSHLRYPLPSPLLLLTLLQVMMVLLIAGCAAATAIGYVGQFGEDHVGWQPICDHVRKFCTTNLVSLLLSYFAFISYFGITLLSAYKIVSSSPKN
ncbi:hypothetical protein JHK85_045044 [Glycine max]|nr:hypothetical protein JHK85_045044 [Glycine max]